MTAAHRYVHHQLITVESHSRVEGVFVKYVPFVFNHTGQTADRLRVAQGPSELGIGGAAIGLTVGAV